MAACRLALLLLVAVCETTSFVAIAPRPSLLRTRMPAMQADEPPPVGDAPAPGDGDAPAPKVRETAEEAWEKAPDGSFLSPALIAGLVVTSMIIREVAFGGASPFS